MKTEVTTRYDGSAVDVKNEQLPLCGPTAALGDTIKDGHMVSQTTRTAIRIVSFTMCIEMTNFGMTRLAQPLSNLSAANQYVQVYYIYICDINSCNVGTDMILFNVISADALMAVYTRAFSAIL